MAKQNQQNQPQQQFRDEQPQDSNQYGIRLGWIIIPLVLIGIYAFINSISPAPELSWDKIMDFMNVHNKERYTMLAIWLLALIMIAALWRILRK